MDLNMNRGTTVERGRQVKEEALVVDARAGPRLNAVTTPFAHSSTIARLTRSSSRRCRTSST